MHHVVLAESLQSGWTCLDAMQRAGLFLYPGSIRAANSWVQNRHDIIQLPHGRLDDVSVVTSEAQIYGNHFDGQVLVPEDTHLTHMFKMYVTHDRVHLEPEWRHDPWTKWWPGWVSRRPEEYTTPPHIEEMLVCLMRHQLTSAR